MKITDIRIFPVDEPKLKAFVSIIFDQSFIVSDIKIIEGNSGLFLSMPSKKRKDGTFKDIAHPLNSETRKMMEDAVIAAYKESAGNKPAMSAHAAEEASFPEADPAMASESH
ncbi:MAG: septation regulator SpoVG [Acidobacteriota bacterium]